MSATNNYIDSIKRTDTVTSAEETANAIVINIFDPDEYIPVDEDSNAIDLEFIVQVRRSGVEIPGFSVSYSSTTGSITVADAGSADLTEDDVVYIMAWLSND
jgi:hypothetical protein